MMQISSKNKEMALARLLTQYDDPDMWIHNYLPMENTTEDEKHHLKEVMVRDQALKKVDADRIVKMTATFPAKLRPELLSPVVDEMRQNNPAVPGSGLVSLCGTVALPKDPNNQLPPSTPQFLRSQSLYIPYENFGSTATTAATTPSPEKRFSFVELSTSPLSATFQRFSDRGDAPPERCPLCHRKFSMFQKRKQCEQCQRLICANCSNEFVTNGVVHLCDECLEITRVLCKTGDWFAQYLVLRPANPLRLEVDLSPAQNNGPSRRGSRQIVDDIVIRHNAVPVLAQPPSASRGRLAAAQQMQQASQTALNRQNAVTSTGTPTTTQNGGTTTNPADRVTWTRTTRRKSQEEHLQPSTTVEQHKSRATLQKSMTTTDGKAPVENAPDGAEQSPKSPPLMRASKQVTMLEPLEQVNKAEEAGQLDRSRKMIKNKLRRYSLSMARSPSKDRKSKANSYSTTNELETSYQTRVEVKGDLEVSLDYDPTESRLAIMVWVARNIAAVDRKTGTSNPYAKVFLYPDPANKTPRKLYCKGHTCSPVFNQGVCYSISPSDMHEKVVIVELWHKKAMGAKMFLGEVKIPLRNHKWDDKERKRLQLEQKHNPIPVTLKPTYRGDLNIGLRFSMSHNHRLISQLNNGSTNFPGLLEVAVRQASYLVSESAGPNVSSFVKAALQIERIQFEPQTTDVIQKSCHPVWNCVLRFADLSQNDLFTMELELSVWHRPVLAKAAQLLGGVRLGCDPAPGVTHHMTNGPHREEMRLWADLIQKPNTWVEGILPLRDISY